jgi:putative ABC transport system permease protein
MKFFNFKNTWSYKLLNITGLSIGVTCMLAITLWAEDELKYDLFNKNADRIYRVIVEEKGTGHSYSGMTMSPLSQALKEKIPGIKKAASFEMDWPIIVHAGENYYNEEEMAVVGKDFFDIFSFPFLKGDPHLLQIDKFSVVLSEKLAKKYFGDAEAVGQTIEIKKKVLKVVAVFRDVDYNSHIRFEMAVPEDFFGTGTRWDNQSLYTYIMLSPGTDPNVMASNISGFIEKNIDAENKMKLALQPLNDIHFTKGFADDDYTYLGDKKYVYIFSFMGFFILVLACINFINLSTAVSEKEIRNNVLRKILGATKTSLIRNSLLKSMFASGIATAIALLLLHLLLPFINDYTRKALDFSFASSTHIAFLIVIILFAGVLSGLYPAIYLASFSDVAKNKNPKSGIALWQRNGLVIFQFSLSIILIIATLVSIKQLNHMRQVNLGFDKEHTGYFRIRTGDEDYPVLKERLLKIPGIEMVAGKNYFSSTIYNTSSVSWPGGNEKVSFSENRVDEDFFPLLKVNFTDGRGFSKELKGNLNNSVIINQQAKELLGKGNPIGKTLNFWGKNYHIIGVIDKTHFKSVNEVIKPEFYVYTYSPDYIFVRYNTGFSASPNSLIKQIKTTVKEIYPETLFDFNFLDATYARLYDNDKRVGDIFSIVALIAIFISCLGLFGLSKFGTEKRIKEIGIRKINGAKISEVLMMLNKDFVKWVIIAFLIATPIAYYAMNKWLENFAYKTNLSWWIFALAGLLALGIALLTVSWQSWRAATRNPVEALRYE